MSKYRRSLEVRPSLDQVLLDPIFIFYLFRILNLLRMVHKSYLAAFAVFVFVPFIHADGLYSKDSSVLQVDAKSYDKLIKKSNLASVSNIHKQKTEVLGSWFI